MWVYNKKPERISDYWCYLSDGTVEKMRICSVGHWRKLDNPYDYRDTGGRDVIAWWGEPKPKIPEFSEE